MLDVLDDLALGLWRQGYDALPRARERHGGADVFWTRLLGDRALVVRGEAGARLFYDDTVVRRADAVPHALADLLFGRGAVHGLDGDEHRQRKALFLQILDDERVTRLGEETGRRLALAADTWLAGPEVRLFDELVRVYGGAVLAWAGTGIEGRSADLVSRDLAAIVDGFGFSLPAYPRAWAARRRSDAWATRLVQEVRAGRFRPDPDSPLELLCRATDLLPSAELAGVELLNLLRPTVAVAWFGVDAAMALVAHPDIGPGLAAPDGARLRRSFVHEVRRVHPFVPALAGRVRREVEWQGHRLHPGDRLVLDVPGTDLHPCAWARPEELVPTRFEDDEPDAFAYVPQGGGDVREGHRCPGEPVAVEVLERTVAQLASLRFDLAGREPDRRRVPTRSPRAVRLHAYGRAASSPQRLVRERVAAAGQTNQRSR